MAEFLTDAWLAAVVDAATAAEVRGAADLSTTLCAIVTGAPAGEVRVQATFADGALVSLAPGTDPDVVITLTTPYADAASMASGELSPNVAFMRGRSKTTGPTGPLLDVLALVDGEAFRAAVAPVLADTTFAG